MSNVETIITDIWCEVLNLDCIDKDAFFLDIGGDSISAELITSRIRNKLHVNLKSSDVIRYESIENLVTYIKTLK